MGGQVGIIDPHFVVLKVAGHLGFFLRGDFGPSQTTRGSNP